MKRIGFQSTYDSFEKINPEFAKVKIHVMYCGENRNGSFISRETVYKMLYSLKNIPVVGEWKSDDFGTHGGKVELSDDGVKFTDTTKPYGVIPSDAEVTWETIREKDGITEHEYLTTTAYLWLGRYPEIEKILDDGANQSMELSITDGQFNTEKNYYEINDGHFSALCILGSDVEPCFASADIEHFSLDKEKFMQDFTEMMTELNFSLDKNNTNHTSNEVDIENIEEGGLGMNEDIVIEEVILDEVVSTEPVVEEFEKTEEVEIIIDSEEKRDFEAEVKIYMDKISALESDNTDLQIKYSELESEAVELRQYKSEKIATDEYTAKEIEVNALFAKKEFAVLTEEEVSELKVKAFEMDLASVEKDLYALVGMKLASKFSLIKNEDGSSDVIKMSLDMGITHEDEVSSKSYAGIIKKYSKQK
ncbi:MAG TPA: hypothetical protein VIM42_12275 [Clostridium sp.]